MKNLTAQFLSAIDGEVSASAYLVEITFATSGTTERYTGFDIPVVKNGNIYNPVAFQLNNVSFSTSTEIDRINVSFDNVGQTFTSIFLNSDERGSIIKLYFVALDDNTKVIDEICLFGGYVETFEINTQQIILSCVSPLVRVLLPSLKKISAVCINKFKDDVCQYQGTDVTCNHTFEDCQSKNNTENFRGGVINTKISTKTAEGEII